MKARPKVSVIIPHFDDLVGLRKCLVALKAQTFPAADMEVIVADNNSSVGVQAVEDVICEAARLVVVTEKGAGPARNGAVAISTGEILAFIDSDCVAEPEWISGGLAALERFDFVGGRVKVLLSNPPQMTPTEAFERVFAFDFQAYVERKGFTGAGNLFCARSLFDRVGGFRVGMSEDVEWSHRARKAGFRLGYAPEAVVGHPARVTWHELSTKWRRVNAETYELSRGQRGRRLAWFLRSLALPFSAIVHTPRVLLSPNLEHLSQRAAAIATLFRLRFWRMSDSWRLLIADREP